MSCHLCLLISCYSLVRCLTQCLVYIREKSTSHVMRNNDILNNKIVNVLLIHSKKWLRRYQNKLKYLNIRILKFATSILTIGFNCLVSLLTVTAIREILTRNLTREIRVIYLELTLRYSRQITGRWIIF